MDQESNEILEWRQDDNDIEILKGIDELKKLLPKNLASKVYQKFVDQIDKSFNAPVGIKELDIKKLESEDCFNIYKGLSTLRKLLLQNPDDDKLNKIIQADKNLVPKIIKLVESSEMQLIKYESVYTLLILINNQYFQKQIINNNGIKVLLDQLKSPHLQISTQACTALGNLALDYQNSIIIQKNGAVELILNILQQLKEPRHIELFCWSLNNIMLISTTDIQKDTIDKAFITLCNLINKHDDELTLLGCFKIFQQSLHFTKENYKILIQSQAIDNLLKLALSQNKKISKASFDLISGLLQSNIELLDQNLSKKCLNLMNKLLHHQQKAIDKESVYFSILSFCNGNENQQIMLCKNNTMITQIIKFVKDNKSDEAREIISILALFSQTKNLEIIQSLIKEGIVQVLIQGLQIDDEDEKEELIKALQNILKIYKQISKQKLLNKKQIEAIKKLPNNKSKTIKSLLKQLFLLLE